MDPVYVIALIWGACAILAAVIAKRRGTNPLNGLLLGLILGPLGVILVAVQKPSAPVSWDR